MSGTSQTSGEPGEFDALVALARREHRSGRLAEAAEAYRQLVALRPDVAEIYDGLGNVLVGQGRLDEAAVEYERAVALKPDLVQTYNNLGNILRLQGKLDDAAARYEHALALKPDYAAAHINLGNVLRDRNQLAEAADRYRQAIALRPDLAAGYENLGSVLSAQGRPDEAAAEYQRAIDLQPNLATAWVSLGNILREQGNLDGAVARFQQAIVLKPDYAEAYNNLAGILKHQRKLDEAAAQYERAVALKPSLFYSHLNLGRVYHDLGRLDQAAASYQQALALAANLDQRPPSQPDAATESGQPESGQPAETRAAFQPAVPLAADLYQIHRALGHIFHEQNKLGPAAANFVQAIALEPQQADAHNSLGNVLMDQRKPNDARTEYEHAIRLDPDHFPAHVGLGAIFHDEGRFDEAMASFQRALAINPRFPDVHHKLGTLLKDLGRIDEARASYAQSLVLRPDYAESFYHLADMKTFSAEDADLAALEAIAANPGRLPAIKMIFLHLALAKALEDVGDYDRAFQHLLQGNTLKRRNVDYNEAACQKTFAQTAELFDSDLLQRFAGVGDPSPVPIFIVGMPRSGSTLVEQILASHPQVHAAGELTAMENVLRMVRDAEGRVIPFPQLVSTLDADGLRRLGSAYLAALPKPADGVIRISDKAPGNFFRVGLIRLILPGARIIHTMRDPVDTCISCFTKSFADVPFSYDLAELGCYYRWYYELMDHWRSVLPAGGMLDVSYEDVVDDLEAQARRLIDYCGLPWDERCLNFHQHNRPVVTASNVQVRRPLYRSSVARWHRYEAHLEPLLIELESCRQG